MTRAPLARLGAVAVVVLLLAELGTRALAPYLPAPELYADQTTAVKIRQLDRVADTPRCATVVVAGNSMARDDLVPSVMDDELDDGVVVYNAALDAAAPTLLEQWVPDNVLPKAKPDLVVIGLSSFDLNDNARISRSALASYRTAALTRDDVFGRLQQPLIRRVALFEHRAALRDPTTVWESFGRIVDGDRLPRPDADGIPGLLDAEGAGLSRRDLRYTPSPATASLLRTELLNDYDSGQDQVVALGRLLATLDEGGVDTALVLLPVTDDYVDAHPGGRAQFDEFVELARKVAATQGTPLVDLHDWGDDADFADTHHLAGAVADELSRELPARLEASGVALPAC